jgi:hypothetical protein
MKSDRFFYSGAGAVFLLLMIIGFQRFYMHGTHSNGTSIDPGIVPIVIAHGIAIMSWYVLFFIQALLINVKNRRLHMKLGWSALAIGLAIAVMSPIVAIESVKLTPSMLFFGMLYSRFLLSMFVEISFFLIFVAAGILTRKTPRIHRAMMLLVCLSLISGAFARMPMLNSIFGATGVVGLYGPAFVLGTLLLLVRWAMTRTLDKWYAAGFVAWVIALTTSIILGHTAAWDTLAAKILS